MLLLQDDIITYLPRLATLLNNTPEEKAIVRSAFLSILASASQSVAAQNARNAELLTAVELMTLLHRSEKEIGLKGTIEGITFRRSFCFVVYKSLTFLFVQLLLFVSRCLMLSDLKYWQPSCSM